MKRRDIIVVVLGAALLCVGVVGADLYMAARRDAAADSVQQTPDIGTAPQALIAAASQGAPDQTQLPPVGSGPAAASVKSTGNAGKTTPDSRSLSDGKETLSDGKEALPPVSEFVGTHPGAVNPGAGAAPTEFLNKQTSTTTNQLLDPPSLQNVAGPVVSPETR